MTDILDPYHAAERTVAWIDRSDRVRLLLTGPDRQRHLQNLTTNDIAALDTGRGCEAFVTSPQGKTLGFVTVHADTDRLLVRTDAGALDVLLPHLEKYGVFDDVTWTDSTPGSYEIHLVGPRAPEALARLQVGPLPADDLGHATVRLLDRSAWLIRESPTGRPGFTLIGGRDDLPMVTELLRDAGEPLGLVVLDDSTFDVLRIEAGTPVFGRDLTADNLPQELDRDRRAISFRKGCYLGQETVARIDALGHVNKYLRGLHFDPGAVPGPGTPLFLDARQVGAVTSSGDSPKFGCPIGLGYVRRTNAAIGTALEFGDEGARRQATIVALPMTPESPGKPADAPAGA